MPEPEPEPEPGTMNSVETEAKQLLGMFDAPAFVRRGQDVEVGITRLFRRCATVRLGMLDMVHLRLRQWSTVASGPDDWRDTFRASIWPLWALSNAAEPQWASLPSANGRRLSVARDLISSIHRFNRRWSHFLDDLNFEPINARIDHYNRYYVLEKECVLGSATLAQRWFVPQERVTHDRIEKEYPLLPVPELARGR